MSVEIHDPEKSFVEALRDVIASIQGEYITLRELLERIGEQGLLLLCMILALPFLFPVSIPGVSTVFGIAIILIGIGVTLNRLPWMPSGLRERQIAAERLLPVLRKGADALSRMERFVRPRMLFFTQTPAINHFNGFMVVASGVLLLFPFGLIPLTNTLPGFAILFLAVGMLQRDGVFILLGYVFALLTVIYFGALFIGAILAGQGIMYLMGSGSLVFFTLL